MQERMWFTYAEALWQKNLSKTLSYTPEADRSHEQPSLRNTQP